MQDSNNRSRESLPVGSHVQVRNRYLGSWTSGFDVVNATRDGYWLRRDSDAEVLPRPFVADDVRRND
ncbi:MAG TPA: hypothetical protein VL856_09900 [Acidimicrobiia bacterium]|jgi:hypothetical protein|nr:hypothetical protein [Acidimicrobiia bacterium]